MTPEEISFIKAIGTSTLKFTVITTISSLLYGFLFLLFCISTAIFLRRGLTTRAKWGMFIITIICFALFTLYFAAYVVYIVIFVKYALVDNITLPQVDNTELFMARLQGPQIMLQIIVELLPIISDMVVVWRAWAIFPTQRRVMIGPIILFTSTIVISILHILSLYDLVPALLNNPPIIDGLWTAAITTSTATNLSATLLLAYNLWVHRRLVSGNLGLKKGRSQAEKILDLLVESGAVYCGIQLIMLVLKSIDPIKGTATYTASQVFFTIYAGISAIYPVIVVVLVNSRRSLEETYGLSLISNEEHIHGNKSRLPIIGHPVFATGPNSSINSKESGEILEESLEKENV